MPASQSSGAPPRQPSRRSLSSAAVVGIALLSLAAHGAALWLIQLDSQPAKKSAPRAPAKKALAPIRSCPFDAVLASSAHALACATPLYKDPWQCLAKEPGELSLSLILCRSKPVSASEMKVAFVDPDKLEIRPAPLIEAPPEVLAQIEREKAEALEKKREEVKKVEMRPKPAGQVVEIVKPEVEIRPDDARYVAEFDSKVQKETVARGSTEKMVERPGPKHLPTARENKNTDARPEDLKKLATAQLQKEGNPDADKGPGEGKRTLAMNEARVRAPGQLFGLAKTAAGGVLPRRGAGGKESPQRDREASPGGGGGSPLPRGAPDLRPTKEMLSRVVGGGSVDWVQNVDRGEGTALNTKRWKFAGFFNRLKRQVAQRWNPGAVYRRHDPTGRIYGTKNRLTVLKVALHKNGKIAKIFIAKPCGVDALDDEAVRAFYAAQPFANPPAGLVDTKSQLITFSFGFHFEVGHRERWRIFRWDD